MTLLSMSIGILVFIDLPVHFRSLMTVNVSQLKMESACKMHEPVALKTLHTHYDALRLVAIGN